MTPTTETVQHATVDSPIGPLTVVVSAAGVRAILWPDDDGPRVPAEEAAGMEPVPAEIATTTDNVTTQLDEYFAGTRTSFDLPLDPIGTEFQREAWRALCAIPYGATVSYGEQAERMGDRNKARAVGAANGRNPIPIIVPCHRVVGSNGSLTGFAGGIDTKRFLLDLERRVSGRTLL